MYYPHSLLGPSVGQPEPSRQAQRMASQIWSGLPRGARRRKAQSLLKRLSRSRDIGDAVGLLCQLDDVLSDSQPED
jgi:hypothetical protein